MQRTFNTLLMLEESVLRAVLSEGIYFAYEMGGSYLTVDTACSSPTVAI